MITVTVQLIILVTVRGSAAMPRSSGTKSHELAMARPTRKVSCAPAFVANMPRSAAAMTRAAFKRIRPAGPSPGRPERTVKARSPCGEPHLNGGRRGAGTVLMCAALIPTTFRTATSFSGPVVTCRKRAPSPSSRARRV
jgi:hypothetical protein